MNIKKDKTKWLAAIAEGQPENAIEEISLCLQEALALSDNASFKEWFNGIIVLSGRWKGLQQDVSLGIIPFGEEKAEKNKIAHTLLTFIDQLPDELIEEHPASSHDRILSEIEDITTQKYDYDIFICYSSKDREQVKPIWEKLRGLGFKVFLSEESLKLNAGDSYFENIERSLRKSKDFLLICSENALKKSNWVELEYQTFFNEFYIKNKEERKIYLLKIENLPESDIPLLLRRNQIADHVDDLIQSMIRNSKGNAPIIAGKKMGGSGASKTDSSPVQTTKKDGIIRKSILAVIAFIAVALTVIFIRNITAGDKLSDGQLTDKGIIDVDTSKVAEISKKDSLTKDLPKDLVPEEPISIQPRYSIPKALPINQNLEFNMCDDRIDCLIEDFLPIGWSGDGKHFAYILEPDNEAAGGYAFIIRVQNMETDKIEWKLDYGVGETNGYNKNDDIVTVWDKFYDSINANLHNFDIQQSKHSLENFPQSVNGRTYTVRLDKQFKGNKLQAEALSVNAEGLGQKRIYSNTYNLYGPLNTVVIGALISPNKKRAAILKVKEKRGWEGPPNKLSVDIIGCDLLNGF